jgi:uncharacterized protein (DUF2141 family)
MYRAALLAALLELTAVARARAAELVVVLHGLESGAGQVEIQLYGVQQRATFPYSDRGVVRNLWIPASALVTPGKPAVVSLGELAPGSYALAVIHDANGNGEIDLNVFGIPTEAWGFSNDAKGNLGPPSFDAAAVTVGGDQPTRIDITLNH